MVALGKLLRKTGAMDAHIDNIVNELGGSFSREEIEALLLLLQDKQKVCYFSHGNQLPYLYYIAY